MCIRDSLDDAEVLLQKRLCDILVFSRNVVREVPPYLRGKNLVHRVSFLNRAEGVSAVSYTHLDVYKRQQA